MTQTHSKFAEQSSLAAGNMKFHARVRSDQIFFPMPAHPWRWRVVFSQVCQDLVGAAVQNGPDPLLLQDIIQVAQDGKAVPR